MHEQVEPRACKLQPPFERCRHLAFLPRVGSQTHANHTSLASLQQHPAGHAGVVFKLTAAAPILRTLASILYPLPPSISQEMTACPPASLPALFKSLPATLPEWKHAHMPTPCQAIHLVRLKGTGCGSNSVDILTLSDMRSPTRPSCPCCPLPHVSRCPAVVTAAVWSAPAV